jgi:hypothetical protein
MGFRRPVFILTKLDSASKVGRVPKVGAELQILNLLCVSLVDGDALQGPLGVLLHDTCNSVAALSN